MKNLSLLVVCLIGCFSLVSLTASVAASPIDSMTFEKVLLHFEAEMKVSKNDFLNKFNILQIKKDAVDLELKNSVGKNRKFNKALEKKIELMEEMAILETQWDIHLIKMRYRKGIELIRLMYEKILGLDHHFTGLRTYQHINILSNPHSFPAFQKTQELIGKKKNKKYNMELPTLLESNPFIAATYTLVSVLIGENSSKEKEKEMEKIACILDFTVRMNADFNVIRNETEYLKNANQALMEDCERLFQEFTKPVGYFVRLEDTRTNDDWESLSHKLEDTLRAMEEEITNNGNISVSSSRQIVNLEFATQRVIDFISQYGNFIGQGKQYYHKFDNIVSTYQHEDICQEKLPNQFDEMKADIKSTIEKFENTYDLPELQGSRLKDLMFGVTE